MTSNELANIKNNLSTVCQIQCSMISVFFTKRLWMVVYFLWQSCQNPNILCQRKVDLGAFLLFVLGRLEMNVLYFWHVSFLNFMMHSANSMTQNSQTVFSSGTTSDVSIPSWANLNEPRCQPAGAWCYQCRWGSSNPVYIHRRGSFSRCNFKEISPVISRYSVSQYRPKRRHVILKRVQVDLRVT